MKGDNMAKVKCKFCGKKIEDSYKRCPKCHKYLRKDNKVKVYGLCFVWFFVQSLLSYILISFSKGALYSEKISDLYIIILLIFIILINSIVCAAFLLKKNKKELYKIIISVLCILFSLFSFTYIFRVIKAFRYENSGELKLLADKYEFGIAKDIKSEIERIFEYDSNGVFSRDVKISNFYTDGKTSNLYLEDSYGNYSLKFYVDMDEFVIKDVTCKFGEDELVLVNDFEKTEQFEFYYAMMIANEVLGEDIKGLAKLDRAIEDVIASKIDIPVNAMFNYEDLEYSYSKNNFSIKGNIYNMNGLGSLVEESFEVIFENNYGCKNKHEWYYGDSSFDYVNWDVKI